MKPDTYYIIQTAPAMFASGDGETSLLAECVGREGAIHLTLSEARRILRQLREWRDADTPRRFPRILKVTTEVKPIKL